MQLHDNKTTSYRQKGMLTPHMGRPKHPLKVHVWGGISRKGRTEIVVFDGIMKSDFFVEEILRGTLLPFVRENYRDNHRLQQDNDPKHRSKLALTFLQDNDINWWREWPSGTVKLKFVLLQSTERAKWHFHITFTRLCDYMCLFMICIFIRKMVIF